jgi:hypothetical protein
MHNKDVFRITPIMLNGGIFSREFNYSGFLIREFMLNQSAFITLVKK